MRNEATKTNISIAYKDARLYKVEAKRSSIFTGELRYHAGTRRRVIQRPDYQLYSSQQETVCFSMKRMIF